MARGAYIGVSKKIYTNSIGDLAVGTTIKINENGSPVDYIIVHQGNPDPSMYDSSCNGTWVLRKDSYIQNSWNNAAPPINIYASSTANTYLNETFFALFDTNVKNAIKNVKIPYVNGYGDSGTVAYGSNGLSTKVFLLSGCEVGFVLPQVMHADGAKLDYFLVDGSTDSSINAARALRIALLNGYSNEVTWWLRTPDNSNMQATAVNVDGSCFYNSTAMAQICYRPAFILPSSLILTNNVVTGAEASYTTKGVARKVKGGYIGITGEIYPNSVGLLPIGSTVKINENGSPVDYLIVHHGNPDSSVYDASCDGTWLLRKSLITNESHSDVVPWNTGSSGVYSESSIHTYLNSTYLSLLDSSVQSTIKTVKIPYKTAEGAGSSSNIATGASGLSTKVFLPSCTELGFTSGADTDNSNIYVEGAKLDYFLSSLAGTSNAAFKQRVANDYEGVATDWWTRSYLYYYSVFYVDSSGYVNLSNRNTFMGIRPAFIIPSSSIVSNGVVTGAQASKVTTGIARRIKKAYIGIGGVARPCWTSGGKPTYYGTINAPDTPRSNVASAKAGSYALFAGGEPGNGSVAGISIVDAYDENYTSYAPSDLQVARTRMAGTSIGNYALFGGGSSNNTPYSYVDAYDEDLTRTTLTSLSWSAELLQATTVGDKAIFNGGSYYTNTNAYNSQLTRLDAPSTGACHANHAAGSTANYALFACGLHSYSTMYAYVEAYDVDLTRHDADQSSTVRSHFFGANVGDYLLFAGGYTAYTGGYTTASVDAYNDALTKTVAPNLHAAKQGAGGASLGNYAIFVGGYTGSARVSNAEAYDGNLQKTTLDPIGTANNNLPSVTLGESALFFSYDNVEVYKLM